MHHCHHHCHHRHVQNILQHHHIEMFDRNMIKWCVSVSVSVCVHVCVSSDDVAILIPELGCERQEI